MNPAQATLQGYIAGCGAIRPDQCPHPPGEIADAWLRGCQRAWDERQEKLRRWMGRGRRKVNG